MADLRPTIGLVLDCHNAASLAGFWAAALGYVTVGEAGAYVMLLPNGRPGPKLLLQRVPEPKSVKNRMHLDIDAVDIEAEAARLQAVGARRVQPDQLHEHGTKWILMTDPEGNEFCVCDGGATKTSRPSAKRLAVRRPKAKGRRMTRSDSWSRSGGVFRVAP